MRDTHGSCARSSFVSLLVEAYLGLENSIPKEARVDSQENKQLMRDVFAELAKGDGGPFVEVLAEDVRWTIIGSTEWSGSWEGKQAVRAKLLDPLFAQFATRYRNTAIRLIAEGDCVVIECRGNVITKAGQPYNNTYCYVCRLEDGKVHELTEYCDTELLTKALTPPWAAVEA
jgi:ketosteroid isomerase-like protein